MWVFTQTQPGDQDVVSVQDFGVKAEYYVKFNFLNTGWTHNWINNKMLKEFD